MDGSDGRGSSAAAPAPAAVQDALPLWLCRAGPPPYNRHQKLGGRAVLAPLSPLAYRPQRLGRPARHAVPTAAAAPPQPAARRGLPPHPGLPTAAMRASTTAAVMALAAGRRPRRAAPAALRVASSGPGAAHLRPSNDREIGKLARA